MISFPLLLMLAEQKYASYEWDLKGLSYDSYLQLLNLEMECITCGDFSPCSHWLVWQ